MTRASEHADRCAPDMPDLDPTTAAVMSRTSRAYRQALRRSNIIEDEDAWDAAERD